MQAKNRDTRAPPKDLLNDDFFKLSESGKKFLFNHVGGKFLYIFLDLGVDEPGVEVSYSKSKNPEIWAIHCTGNDERPLNCINKWGVAKSTHYFFNAPMKPTQEDDIAFHHDDDILDNVLNHDRLGRVLAVGERSQGYSVSNCGRRPGREAMVLQS